MVHELASLFSQEGEVGDADSVEACGDGEANGGLSEAELAKWLSLQSG